MLSENCKILVLDYKSTGKVAKYCLNSAWVLPFWEVKLFVLDLLQTTSAYTSENVPTKRQWEIQYSMIWTPVHCFSTTFSRADGVCYKSNVNSFTSQNSKTHALFRLLLLPYLLIYNLEVSFNFHLTFLRVNVHCTVKLFFSLSSSYFLHAPDDSNFFSFPLKVQTSIKVIKLGFQHQFDQFRPRLVPQLTQVASGLLFKVRVVSVIRGYEKPQAAQAHYVWVRASEVIWSEYTRIISVLSDAK